MKKFIMKNKFLVLSVILLIVFSIVDMSITYRALNNTLNQVISMLMIVPPIFILIGLFDVWVPRERVIALMGEKSGARGMFLAFLLGAFSAGPTVAAFPVAIIMLKKGAKYSNAMFFIMTWSTLKIPIMFFQVSQVGWQLTTIINLSMLFVFIIGALFTDKLFSDQERNEIIQKAEAYSKK